jgi:hypothetical protein
VTSDTTDESAPLNRRGLIPVWAPLLVMVAVVLTGIVLGSVGTSYTVLFAVSAIVCTALVELRGLFLTVVMLPVYWFFGVTVAGLMGGSSSATGSNFKATLITVAYPAIEKFLWLAVTFIVCLVIAVARQRIDAAVLRNQRQRDHARRRRLSDAEQHNQRLNARVRDVDRTPATERPRRTARVERADRADRPMRTERTEHTERPGRSQPTTRAYRTTTEPPSSPEARPAAGDTPEAPETRTRTAAELREASRRRRSRSQDRPLDMD